MAKRKSTAEELLDIISEVCFHLPGWAILVIPILCGGGSYLLSDYLIQNKLQTILPGETGSTVRNTIAIVVFGLTSLAALKGFLGRKRRKALLAQTQSLDALRALTWQNFELLVAEAYRSKGFSVTEMGGSAPDGGIDLTATAPNGERYLIQCKHYRTSKVGVKIVREMLGVLAKAGGSRAVIIATGEFTKEATRFAEGQPIELINGTTLLSMLATHPSSPASHAPSQSKEPTPITDPADRNHTATPMASREATHTPSTPEAFIPPKQSDTCPTCGASLVERIAKRGANAGNAFYGCSQFPKCRYTRSA